MLNSVSGLTRKRDLRRVEPLVNTVLMSYGQHIIEQSYCGEFSGIVLYPPIQVSWSRCYALWVVVATEVLSQTNHFFFLEMHQYHY